MFTLHVSFHNTFVRLAARHSRACRTYEVRTLGSSPTHSCGLTNEVCDGFVVGSVLVDEGSPLPIERSVKPYFNKIFVKSVWYDSKSSSRIPRIRFLNLMK